VTLCVASVTRCRVYNLLSRVDYGEPLGLLREFALNARPRSLRTPFLGMFGLVQQTCQGRDCDTIPGIPHPTKVFFPGSQIKFRETAHS